MLEFLKLFVHVLAAPFRTQAQLEAEITMLRHQLNVLQRQASSRPVEADEDQAIYGFQLGSGWHCPSQNDELLPQVKDLSITPRVCAKHPRDQHPEKSQNNDHPGGSLSDWNAVDRLDKIFSRDSLCHLL